MATQEAVMELVRRFEEGFNTGDVDALAEGSRHDASQPLWRGVTLVGLLIGSPVLLRFIPQRTAERGAVRRCACSC